MDNFESIPKSVRNRQLSIKDFVIRHIYLIIPLVSAGAVSIPVFSIAGVRFDTFSYILVGAMFVTWACFIALSNPSKYRGKYPGLSDTLLVIISLIVISSTYLFHGISDAIIEYTEIKIPQYISSISSIIVISSIPGWLLCSLFLKARTHSLLRISLSIILSFILVSTISLILYFFHLDLVLIRPLILVIILGIVLIKKSLGQTDLRKYVTQNHITVNKWHILSFMVLVTVVSIALTFALSHPFLIPGDQWFSLAPGYFVQKSLSLNEFFSYAEYPVMWGFLMGALSSATGMPIINVNVIMFPFTVITIMSFYTLCRSLFGLRGRILSTALVLFGFTGGFAWIVNLFYQQNFWTISYRTMDMYFSTQIWNNFAFTHKGLALSSCLLAITSLGVALRATSHSEKIFLSICSVLLIEFGFFLHMVETLFAFPIMVFILILKRGSVGKSMFLTLLVTAVGFFYLVDYSSGGQYSTLFIQKFYGGLHMASQEVPFLTWPLYNIDLILPIPALIVLTSRFKNRFTKGQIIQYVAVIILVGYILSPKLWAIAPNYEGLLYYSNHLPWYFIAMKFGIVGLLAIFSLFFHVEKKRWSVIVLFWVVLTLIVGNIWWSSRTLDFMYPAVVVAAAFGLMSFIFKYFKVTNVRNKVLAGATLGVIIFFASTSYLFTIYHFTRDDLRGLGPNTLKSINWIYKNVYKNGSVVVSNDYEAMRSFQSFAAHKIILLKDFNINMNTSNYQAYLRNKNIQFIYAPLNAIEQRPGFALMPVTLSAPVQHQLGIAEIGVKGYNLDSPENSRNCDWLTRLDAKSIQKESSASATIDNDLGTAWNTSNTKSGLQLEIGFNNMICDVRIAWYKGDELSYNFTIAASVDGISFRDIFHGMSSGKSNLYTTYDVPDRLAKYIRVKILGIEDTLPKIFNVKE